MNPIFANPPGDVITFSSRNAYIAFLETHGVPYDSWAPKMLSKRWREITKNDAVYVVGSLWGSSIVPIRCIVTVSVRVMVILPDGARVLIEFVRDGAFYRVRKHTDSSLSEKVILTDSGTVSEELISAIVRCLAEEAGITVAAEEVTLHFMPWMSKQSLIGGALHVEQDFHEDILKTRGLWNFNQVAHFVAYLPEHAYFIGWRKDVQTRYLLRWGDTRETSAQLDPVPIEFIL